MTLSLRVDGERWRSHLRLVAETHPDLVPVAKGNGYGFGLGRLARRTQWLADHGLGGDVLAVGTYDELPEVVDRFGGSLLVLSPWRPFGAALDVLDDDRLADRVIHTVSRPEDLARVLARRPNARIVLERMTSMTRHGLSARELWACAESLGTHPKVRLDGVALHLPLARGAHLPEVRRLLNDIVGAGLPTSTIWVSHLTDRELESLRGEYPDYRFRPRVGTRLWLGDRTALRVTATVLDVHPIGRGDVFGYRGRTAPKDGHLLVVSGGTAHGIGLEAPTGDRSARARAAAFARGGMDAVGWVRSPYSIDGKLRLFAEPPHMQASMLFLPIGAPVPRVGDEVDVRVRYTATTFDAVEIA